MKSLLAGIKRNRVPYLFLLPTVVGMLLLQVLPIGQGLYLAFLRSRKDKLLDYLFDLERFRGAGRLYIP